MRQHIRLGRVAGIPVGAHWSVLVILLLVADGLAEQVLPAGAAGYRSAEYWLAAVLASVAFLGCLLAHEMAHAVVARRRGVGVRSLTLWMLGGLAELDRQPGTAKAELEIAVAGPLTSLLGGIFFLAIGAMADGAGASPLIDSAAIWLGVINLLLAAFNLLPAAPLDGGRVLAGLLWLRSGDRRRSLIIAARAGRWLGMTFVALGILETVFGGFVGGLWLVLIGWFVITAAKVEEQHEVMEQALHGVTVEDVMLADPVVVPAALSVADFVERIALHSRQIAFPVDDPDGRLVGVVGIDQVGQRAALARDPMRVGDITRPIGVTPTARPDEPLTDLLDRLRGVDPRTPVLVLDHGRLVGLVTHDDRLRALRQAALRNGATRAA